MGNEEAAMELVRGFIEEYLHGNIDELKNFSFWDVEGIDKYDGNPKGKFDGDRTEIVYAIDYLIWGKELKNYFDNYKYFGEYSEEGYFAGDTINTFRTLFGGEKSDKERVRNNLSEFEKRIVDEFERTYQKLGNFYFLPVSKPDGLSTVNQFRGTSVEMRDYFDIFLEKLNLCLQGRKDTSLLESMVKIINFKMNKSFFDKFSTIQEFCNFFYIGDYLTITYNHPNKNNPLTKADISHKQYKQFAFSYIQKATELINKRSEKLVEVLKEKYPELKIKRQIN